MNKPMALTWSTPVAPGDPTQGNLGGSIQSNVVEVLGRGGSLHLGLTGTPTGTITIYGSNNHNPDAGAERNGRWESLNSLIAPALVQPAGAPATYFINASQLKAAYIYVDYARSGGSGVMSGEFMHGAV